LLLSQAGEALRATLESKRLALDRNLNTATALH
jgi:hypothetical protein